MLISEPEAILNTNSATNLFDNIYTGNMQTDISHVDFGLTRVHRITRIFLPKNRNYTRVFFTILIPHKTGNFILVLPVY